jgi:cytidyltransferase-like protein
MIRVYIDGIFDLFHRGHIESLKQAKKIDKDVFLIVGVISDSVATEYKREPVINETDRIEIIKSINIVDMVITDPPLIVTKEFVIKNNIDLVVHGFSNETDWNNQKNFFKWLIENNKFKRINYYEKTSTTNIIKKIKDSY